MWIRRILVIPAVAALAVSGAALFGAAGTASAATTAPAAQRAVVTQQAIPSQFGWIKYDYYSSEVLCELEGTAFIGESWGDGYVWDYSCEYVFGEGWLLSLLVEPECPAVTSTPPAKVAPDARVSSNVAAC